VLAEDAPPPTRGYEAGNPETPMPTIVKDARGFVADRAWGARDLAEVEGATVRLHWTDQPYVWHVNDGAEVFVVLDGVVEMRYREAGQEKVVRLEAADMFIAAEGDEHVAHPQGQARILVIERKGSV
jgi:mannose-6-phosphate isomerase-like protein (cupin superfamily)